MKKIISKNLMSGFTLIETMFAILIFSSALAGLLVVSGGGIRNADFAKNQLIASHLAQEGIEMVRNIRDTDSINKRAWLSSLAPCVAGNCDIDPLSLVVSGCGGSCPQIFGSSFTRTIMFNTISPIELEITSVVSWKQGTADHNVVFTENIFNWY